MDHATEKLGWYGKIPAAGDFVHRRMPRELIAWWDRWLQYGLAALKQAPDDSAERRFAHAPIWNFAIPSGPSGNGSQRGRPPPSRHRVGAGNPPGGIMSLPPEAYPRRSDEQPYGKE